MVVQPIDGDLPGDKEAAELERLLSVASAFQAFQRLRPVHWSTEPLSEPDRPSTPKPSES